jgi:hypothetical protein
MAYAMGYRPFAAPRLNEVDFCRIATYLRLLFLPAQFFADP